MFIVVRDCVVDIFAEEKGLWIILIVNGGSEYMHLRLIHQLKLFLSIPGIWEKLPYRNTRQKKSATAIEDIFDAAEYIRLMQDGGPLASRFNFYVFNLDECRTSKKEALKIWTAYIRLNELPPEMRQKFYFLAGVYVDYVDPNFQAFKRPVSVFFQPATLEEPPSFPVPEVVLGEGVLEMEVDVDSDETETLGTHFMAVQNLRTYERNLCQQANRLSTTGIN